MTVEQPPRIMLLNILLHVTAPAERIIGYIKSGNAEYQEKYSDSNKRSQQKEPSSIRLNLLISHRLNPPKFVVAVLFYHKAVFLHSIRPAIQKDKKIQNTH